MSDIDPFEIPAFLKAEKRTEGADMKPGPREIALREMRAAETKRAFDPYAKEHAEHKTQGRIASLKAKISGDAAKMPLTGKEAIALIAAEDPEASAPAKPEESAMETETVTTEAENKTPAKRKPASKPKTPKKKTAAKKAAPRKASSKKAKPARAAKPKEGGVRPGSKTELVANLLRRPEGCTNADALAATGWPTLSMPQQAKAAGLELRIEKVKGEPTRYFGT